MFQGIYIPLYLRSAHDSVGRLLTASVGSGVTDGTTDAWLSTRTISVDV